MSSSGALIIAGPVVVDEELFIDSRSDCDCSLLFLQWKSDLIYSKKIAATISLTVKFKDLYLNLEGLRRNT